MSRDDWAIKLKSTLTLAAPLAALLGGCAEEEELSDICEWVFDPNECDEVDTSGDTGGGKQEENEYPNPCTVTADGHTRTVYQCNGSFSASISFNTLLGDCAQTLGDPQWCD